MSGSRPIDIMIAGAQKAGTSSLAIALAQHPEVTTHPQSSEFTYFLDPARHTGGYEEALRHLFPHDPTRILLAKSAGIMFLPEAADRLAEHNPDCRIVVSLRNPIDRAWSAYWYLRRAGREPADTFAAAIELEEDRLAQDPARFHVNAYLARGDYLPQLQELEKRFAGQVTVCLFDDLVADQVTTVRAVAEQVGLDPTAIGDVDTVQENRAAASRSTVVADLVRRPGRLGRRLSHLLPPERREALKRSLLRLNERPLEVPPLEPEQRAELVAHFRPRNAALGEHLGRDLSHWDR